MHSCDLVFVYRGITYGPEPMCAFVGDCSMSVFYRFLLPLWPRGRFPGMTFLKRRWRRLDFTPSDAPYAFSTAATRYGYIK